MDLNSTVTTASSLILASKRLIESYQNESDDKNFVEIRRDVYNKAMLYKDKLAPFSEVVVKNIGKDCDSIIFSNEGSFKSIHNNLIIKTRLNKDLCLYTNNFHSGLLTEFKAIENKIIRNIKQLDLDDEYKDQISKFTSEQGFKIVEIREIFTSSIKGKNRTKQIIHYEKTLTVFEPLLESIVNYNKFLKGLCGKINNLHNSLEDLNERIKDGEPFDFIKGNAKDVKKFCCDYHEMAPDFNSDLNSIGEDNLDVLDNNYIDNWIQNMIDKISEKEELEKFTDLLTKMEENKFTSLRTIKKICKDRRIATF